MDAIDEFGSFLHLGRPLVGYVLQDFRSELAYITVTALGLILLFILRFFVCDGNVYVFLHAIVTVACFAIFLFGCESCSEMF